MEDTKRRLNMDEKRQLEKLTLRLYAAGEEARDLFAMLANEISKVLN